MHGYAGQETAQQPVTVMPHKPRNTIDIGECGERFRFSPQEASSKPRQPPTSRPGIAQHGEFATFFCYPDLPKKVFF